MVDRHGDCRFGERVVERARVIVPNEVQGEDVVIDDRQPLGMNAGSAHSDRGAVVSCGRFGFGVVAASDQSVRLASGVSSGSVRVCVGNGVVVTGVWGGRLVRVSLCLRSRRSCCICCARRCRGDITFGVVGAGVGSRGVVVVVWFCLVGVVAVTGGRFARLNLCLRSRRSCCICCARRCSWGVTFEVGVGVGSRGVVCICCSSGVVEELVVCIGGIGAVVVGIAPGVVGEVGLGPGNWSCSCCRRSAGICPAGHVAMYGCGIRAIEDVCRNSDEWPLWSPSASACAPIVDVCVTFGSPCLHFFLSRASATSSSKVRPRGASMNMLPGGWE